MVVKCLSALVCMIAAAGMALRAQQPPPDQTAPQKPAATFRSTVDLVAVDVNVIDSTGRPVRDLTPDDFTLIVDGRPRRIVSADFISLTSPAAPQAPPAALHYSTNATSQGGRMIMLVVDQGNIRHGEGRAALDAASRFIDRLNSSDRVGLSAIPGGIQVDFTSNHALVRTMLDRVIGRSAPMGNRFRVRVGLTEAIAIQRGDRSTLEEAIDRECAGSSAPEEMVRCQNEVRSDARAVYLDARQRTSESLLALRGIIERLARSRGPKTLVLLSEGMPFERRSADLEWLGPRTAEGEISLYALRLDAGSFDATSRDISPTFDSDRDLRIEGLETVTGLARGTLFQVTGKTDAAFDRLEREISGYYLISFAPETGDRDGRPHSIKVEVRRPNVQVRARRAFTVTPAARSARSKDAVLAEALVAPLLATDLPVGLTSYTFFDPAQSKLKVLIVAEIDRAASPDGDLAAAFAVIDSGGKVAASQIEEDLAPEPGRRVQLYSGAILLDPGAYTLKFAVLDEEGNLGSVERAFRAQLSSAGQIRFGDLMLAESGADERVRPTVDGRIADDTLVGYFEVYSTVSGLLEQVDVRLEVARSENDAPIETGEAPLRGTSTPGRRVFEGSVPVGFLSPGAYVARAVILVNGRPVGRAIRPFTIVEPAR